MSFEEESRVVEAVIAQAAEDPDEAERLGSDPAALFREAGLAIPDDTRDEFNAFFKMTSGIDARALQDAPEGALAWPSFGCSACSVVCWGVAAAIVALGAVKIAALGTGSAIVVKFAGIARVSPETALIFLKSLSKSASKGVAAVVAAMCIFIGACSKEDLG